ncbi:hypothetical protein FDECE_1888 [Fusarium decemcellulare]|nr:hypothetical protein FDECE_1888 [Fusarium decemcellulare]
MCQDLVANIPSTVDAALDDLDEQSKQMVEALTLGPFSVLKLDKETPQGQKDSSEPSPDPQLRESAPQLEPQEHHSSNTINDNVQAPNDFLQWSDLFNWDLNPSVEFLDPVYLGDGLGVGGWNWQLGDPVLSALEATTASSLVSTLNAPSSSLDHTELPPAIDLLADAPVLLKHFEDTVMHQMSSLPVNEKSPWTILHIPTAIVTLSQLTVFGMEQAKIRHANLSNLFGLLAVASYHLSSNPLDPAHLGRPENHWTAVHQATYRTAKKHLDLCIEHETQGPRNAKYKEQLMAMNATLTTADISNNTADFGHYIVELEKIIRYRGLAKRTLSRRARLLHHIYAWVRIVSETTRMHSGESVGRPESYNHNSSDSCIFSANTQNLGSAVPRTNNLPVVTLDDFFRLEPRPSVSHRGLENHDIHLESSGEDDKIYMQVYGIPETWLRLLSQTTRLANVMDLQESRGSEAHADSPSALQLRADQLERAIFSFTTKYQASPPKADANSTGAHAHMLRALCSALVIYFYRRIRHVSPMILQSHINDVIQALKGFDQALEKQGVKGPGTPWPAFIAGCESISESQRAQIMTWIDAAILKCGFGHHKTAKRVMTEVWRRQDTHLNAGHCASWQGKGTGLATWMEVCRDMRCWLVLA